MQANELELNRPGSLNVAGAPHLRGPASVLRIMLTVLVALLPGIGANVWFFGWGGVIHIAIACVVALASEAFMLRLRHKPIVSALSDGSALVAAFLLALCIPPLAPWWITALGAAFAIVIAKHLYGGLGHNVFNPAMVGYVVLLISFPREMTSWLTPEAGIGFMDSARIILGAAPNLDTISGATPLDLIKTETGQGIPVSTAMSGHANLFGIFAGNGWEWINIGFLIGGLWLLYKKVVTWHIPVALLSGLVVMAFAFHVIDPTHYASATFHLFSGATMLGAFFIATDPVTASTTPTGRLLYGAGIGVLTYIIRTWGGYPDAVAFAVLLMNMSVPTIDQYTQPRVFGHTRD